GEDRKYVLKPMRIACVCLSVLMLLCTIALVAFYPFLLITPPMWAILSIVVITLLREAAARRLVGRKMRRTISKRAFWEIMTALYLVSLGLACWTLFLNLSGLSAWQMLGGFALGALLEIYSLWRQRDMLALEGTPDDTPPELIREMSAELKSMGAYNAYQRLHLLVLMALQMTLILVYTFIGLTITELFTCMVLAVASTLVMRELADFCLKRVQTTASTQVLLVGLFLWLYGLFLFYRKLGAAPDLTMGYVDLCLSVSGLTISGTALADLETRMTDVAQFKLQKHMQGYSKIRTVGTEMAITLGQLLALISLTVLCIPQGMLTELELGKLAATLKPLMIVPPLLMVLAALISALQFPMNNRYFAKLAKWLTLEEEGESNPALRAQLDSVVVKRHKNRFGVKIIITILRPLYYHKVIGKERLQGYEDGSMILVCNHGELYGPVVANLYVPVTFRPWVIAEMTNREAIVEHMYVGTMMRQRWIPEKWKRPILRAITPILIWVFDSLEAIPVHRGKPRELMHTFRDTMDAMQAGDNVLLFPENGENHAPGEKGYALEGVGQLYTGFAMIAPMYYAKTKKCAVFVPIYASKKLRTVTIGEGIVYDPKANASEEKMRIVNGLLGQMQGMYEKEEAKLGQGIPS
ncbi:MAG: hypothetical protein PHI98_17075, partial [Eubacteriales bacterium]|nr:hypothetical protein [Eubacteriales bacterium]